MSSIPPYIWFLLFTLLTTFILAKFGDNLPFLKKIDVVKIRNIIPAFVVIEIFFVAGCMYFSENVPEEQQIFLALIFFSGTVIIAILLFVYGNNNMKHKLQVINAKKELKDNPRKKGKKAKKAGNKLDIS